VPFVSNSIDGYHAGGSLCLNNKNLKPFVTSSLHLYQPNQKGREAIPPHIKTFVRYHDDGELAWVLLTSSNMSKAAWGTLQKSNTQLAVRNFEVGVLFLPSGFASKDKGYVPRFVAGSSPFKFEESSISFPVPSMIPPKPYSVKDEAWTWDVPHQQPDIFGATYST